MVVFGQIGAKSEIFIGTPEQVHVRGLFGRGLRLALIGTGMAAGSMAFAASAHAATGLAASDSLATQTRLDGQTRVVARNGRNFTQGVFTVAVTDADGKPATGAVLLEEGDKAISGVVLDAGGKASVNVDLVGGVHTVRAVYQGDAVHAASTSATTQVTAEATGTADFQVAVNPGSLTLTQGESGDAVISVTPENSSALTGPMFVTLACAGLPDQSTCVFTPENVEIQVKATTAVTSDMVLTTQAKPTHGSKLEQRGNSGVALAILIPGAMGLLGLAGFARKGGWARLVMIGLVALVASLGMTACNPRYDYYNHGPNYNLPTPAGTYQMTITAQSSDGVTAITHPTTFVLTVKAAATTD